MLEGSLSIPPVHESHKATIPLSSPLLICSWPHDFHAGQGTVSAKFLTQHLFVHLWWTRKWHRLGRLSIKLKSGRQFEEKWVSFTCGLMFPRYKLVVDGSPTSWEPGAQSSKTADTEETEELSNCSLTGNKCFLSKLKVFTVTILSQNYHWKDGFSLKNHPLKEAEKQYKFCFRTGEGKRAWGGVRGQELGVQGWPGESSKVHKYLHERLPSLPERGSNRLTRPFNRCLSSLSSCIL